MAAKKSTSSKSSKSVAKTPAVVAISSTPVRNTPIPKPAAIAAPAKIEITHEMVARRAFEISQSAFGGSQEDNWLRAEQELRTTA